MFVLPILMALATFALSCYALYQGEVNKWNVQDEFPLNHRYPVTCAYEGPHGHILWRFAYSSYDSVPNALPNWWSYSMIAIVFFFVDPFHVKLMTLFCFYGLATIAKFMVEWSLESSAFWCFTTVSISVFVLCEPIIEKIFGYVEPKEVEEKKNN